MLRHNAIEAWDKMLKTGWRWCNPPVRWGSTPSVEGCAGCFFDLRQGELIVESMPIANQQCACEPCGCSVSPDKAVEKDGKIYCSQPCADGHAGEEQWCSSCDCCWLVTAVAELLIVHCLILGSIVEIYCWNWKLLITAFKGAWNKEINYSNGSDGSEEEIKNHDWQ